MDRLSWMSLALVTSICSSTINLSCEARGYGGYRNFGGGGAHFAGHMGMIRPWSEGGSFGHAGGMPRHFSDVGRFGGFGNMGSEHEFGGMQRGGFGRWNRGDDWDRGERGRYNQSGWNHGWGNDQHDSSFDNNSFQSFNRPGGRGFGGQSGGTANGVNNAFGQRMSRHQSGNNSGSAQSSSGGFPGSNRRNPFDDMSSGNAGSFENGMFNRSNGFTINGQPVGGETSPASFAAPSSGSGQMIASSPGNNRWNRFSENHPRRSEVLSRDNNLNNEIQADKGDLGGHYNQLEREARGIDRQEQADARLNGGYITPGEQRQLNHEENRLQNQIKRDYNPNSTQPGGSQSGGAGSSGSTPIGAGSSGSSPSPSGSGSAGGMQAGSSAIPASGGTGHSNNGGLAWNPGDTGSAGGNIGNISSEPPANYSDAPSNGGYVNGSQTAEPTGDYPDPNVVNAADYSQ